MAFKQSYLCGPDDANREALTYNLQEEITLVPEFKEVIEKLSITDSGIELVFAYSLVDTKVNEMTLHNQQNYLLLELEAITALDILNAELDNFAKATKTDKPTHQVLKPLIDATGRLTGRHPVLRFCEDRDLKGVIERVEDMIDSLHSTIVKVASNMGQETPKLAQGIH